MLLRLFPALLFVVSLVPRLVAVGRYITPDELIWVYRTIQFREALLQGRWADMIVAGHPGVTTTWLGALGMIPVSFAPGLREAYNWLTAMASFTPDNVEAIKRLALLLDGGRVAVALVNSLGVVGVYLLVRRLWGNKAAVTAGLFLALDPFLAGLSGLFHVDGLSTTFVTLSLLTLLVGLRTDRANGAGGRSRHWLALAGVFAALAALSKTPTLLLLPVTGLALLWPVARDRDRSLSRRLSALLRDGLIWIIAFLVVSLLLYPPLWSSPGAVLATVGGSANRHLDEALRETFFLGRTAYDHGPLFYPVVLLWRLSPVVWLAIFPAVRQVIASRRNGRGNLNTFFPALLLAFWAVAFLVAITPAAKKFDRYILPAVPALLILAAISWTAWTGDRGKSGRWVLALIISVQALYCVIFAAYPLAAYNPLVGGPRTAAAVLPVGWGESISASGRWLAEEQPNVETTRAMAGVAPSLAPFFPGQTLIDGVDDPATANYTIVTLGGRQLDPTGWEDQTRGLDQIQVVRFGGLDQAWIYERPSPSLPVLPTALTEPITFGERMALVAYEQHVEDDTVAIATQWRRLAPLLSDERYTLRLVIRDDAGNVWATQETDLTNEVAFFPADWSEAQTGTVRYLLEIPPGIPPATYNVTMSLIDNRTGGQLPIRAGEGGFRGVVFTAGEIDVPAPERVISASRLQIPQFTEATWLDGQLRLLGQGGIPAEALAGGELLVDLFWHVPEETLPPGLQIGWRLRPSGGGEAPVVLVAPLSRHDTGLWRTGETIQEKYRVPLPPDLAAGSYELSVEPLLSDGTALAPAQSLGEMKINNIDRLYEAVVPVPFHVGFSALDLLGLDTAELSARPGDAPELTLFWEKYSPHGEVYTVFVHLLDEAGNIVQYADHWPGGLPTDILDSGQMVIDSFAIPLPADLPSGDYQVRVGLYSAESGARLPAHSFVDGDAGFVGNDFAILPLQLQVTRP